MKNVNEQLTLEMTYLSNERSFLAYMRTFVVFLSSGIAVLNINKFENYHMIGVLFIIAAISFFVTGIVRFFVVKKNVRKIIISSAKEIEKI